jgi:hypothetical protein
MSKPKAKARAAEPVVALEPAGAAELMDAMALGHAEVDAAVQTIVHSALAAAAKRELDRKTAVRAQARAAQAVSPHACARRRNCRERSSTPSLKRWSGALSSTTWSRVSRSAARERRVTRSLSAEAGWTCEAPTAPCEPDRWARMNLPVRKQARTPLRDAPLRKPTVRKPEKPQRHRSRCQRPPGLRSLCVCVRFARGAACKPRPLSSPSSAKACSILVRATLGPPVCVCGRLKKMGPVCAAATAGAKSAAAGVPDESLVEIGVPIKLAPRAARPNQELVEEIRTRELERLRILQRRQQQDLAAAKAEAEKPRDKAAAAPMHMLAFDELGKTMPIKPVHPEALPSTRCAAALACG